MPDQSRSRDRYGQSRNRARERERERRRDREYEREREYTRGRYDDDEAVLSSPGSGRKGKYRFQGEEAYDSHGRDESDGFEDEERMRRERRRRRREEEGSRPRDLRGDSPVKSRERHRERERDRDRDGHRRRREYVEGEGSPTKRTRDRRHRDREGETDAETEARRQRRREKRERERERERGIEAAAAVAAERKHGKSESTNSASGLLTADALAQRAAQESSENEPDEDLTSQWEEQQKERQRSRNPDEDRRDRRRRRQRAALAGAGAGALGAEVAEGRSRHKSGARVVSGAYLEEGRSSDMNVRRRGGGGPAMHETYKSEESWDSYDDAGRRPFWKFWDSWSKKKRIWIGALAGIAILLAIIIPVAVTESKKNSTDSGSDSSSSSSSNMTSNLDSISRDSIPSYAQGTVIDPFTWYDTEGFNLTFTNATVGGLYLMGLNSSWDNSARPNDNVPPLTESFPYGSQPIRGVSVGGWFSIEPWITPSLFDTYSTRDGIRDEWTLSSYLGSDSAATTIEKHYATFCTEQDFAEIAEAGLDHVRIPYSYWAVKVYDGDPYVPKISWRYLLRAIEWCRKYGLRVNLDLHGIPGSQNGWEHSGHQGLIGWLNGTNGDLNANRSLEIHDQLTQFFAQDRYSNIVTMYSVVNEPFMLTLSAEKVLTWTNETTKIARKNGLNATVVFHDGFLNLDKWDTMFKEHPDNMYLDTHQYTTFNTGEIVLNHTARIELVCSSWYTMIEAINKTSEGWGPTICGEWSQADTDCAKYLNNVGRGTRWEGTYDTSSTTQYCPTADDNTCSCTSANAEPSEYSAAYKKWLLYYGEAQMSVFETAMGWFYWTWRTETAYQWSYRTAWKEGFMPSKAYSPSFKCGDTVPDFSSLGLSETY